MKMMKKGMGNALSPKGSRKKILGKKYKGIGVSKKRKGNILGNKMPGIAKPAKIM